MRGAQQPVYADRLSMANPLRDVLGTLLISALTFTPTTAARTARRLTSFDPQATRTRVRGLRRQFIAAAPAARAAPPGTASSAVEPSRCSRAATCRSCASMRPSAWGSLPRWTGWQTEVTAVRNRDRAFAIARLVRQAVRDTRDGSP